MTAEQSEYIRLESMEQLGFGIHAMQQCKVCGACGVISAARETVCVSCGAALPEETLFEQYQKRHKCCQSCGTVVASESLYCPQCGVRLMD